MKKKILILATSQVTIESFLLPHIKKLKKKYDITILTKLNINRLIISDVKIFNINLDRKINVLNDIKNLIYLYNFLKLNNFNFIFTITPKAGLLGMLSAFVNKIPIRLHIFTGQVWSNKNFLYKYILKLFDKLIMKLSNETLCDGKRQREFLIENSFSKKIKVLGNGSICGVDTNLFKPNKKQKLNLRKKFKIKNNEVVFLYVGRINKDKGINNILSTLKLLSDSNFKCRFIFVGNHEDENLKHEIKKNKKVIHVNHLRNISKFYQFADIYITSSYREGFGMTVAQAMSSGLPVIGTNIYGLKDLLKNGRNCITYEPDDLNKLYLACCKLIENEKLRKKFGLLGRKIIIKNFQEKDLVRRFENFFKLKLS
ncbi:MAG: hypothetical protein CMM99_01310 [Rickettsiales bacterium]|nr:hypothetical protein [Rickettsiales bacterium]